MVGILRKQNQDIILRGRLVVGQWPLKPLSGVRVPAPQPIRLATLAHGFQPNFKTNCK